uniref:Uncharacterized protein n=1 Tax=Anguilla anguilla TaxID=7936 RepID=A0A0E9UNT2_ANGAN
MMISKVTSLSRLALSHCRGCDNLFVQNPF